MKNEVRSMRVEVFEAPDHNVITFTPEYDPYAAIEKLACLNSVIDALEGAGLELTELHEVLATCFEDTGDIQIGVLETLMMQRAEKAIGAAMRYLAQFKK